MLTLPRHNGFFLSHLLRISQSLETKRLSEDEIKKNRYAWLNKGRGKVSIAAQATLMLLA